jgi:hypothetical protein
MLEQFAIKMRGMLDSEKTAACSRSQQTGDLIVFFSVPYNRKIACHLL